MGGRAGALSIKPSEGSRSRVRRTRPMDFQSIFARKSLPEAGFGKNVVIDADRCSGSRVMSIILTRGGLLFKTGKSDHRFKCLHLPRASVRRASGFVLTVFREEPAFPVADANPVGPQIRGNPARGAVLSRTTPERFWCPASFRSRGARRFRFS